MQTFERLPGWELVSAGLADLAVGRVTIEGELVRSAADGLRERGLPVPVESGDRTDSGQRLYRLVLADVGPRRAHARYNALRRRLASFLHASAHARTG